MSEIGFYTAMPRCPLCDVTDELYVKQKEIVYYPLLKLLGDGTFEADSPAVEWAVESVEFVCLACGGESTMEDIEQASLPTDTSHIGA